jgi:hypothetical protein
VIETNVPALATQLITQGTPFKVTFEVV